MTDELALKILAEIAAPGSGHLFSRRGAAAHAIALIEQQAARIAELEADCAELEHDIKRHIFNHAADLAEARIAANGAEPVVWYGGNNYCTTNREIAERFNLRPAYAAPVASGQRYDWSVSGMKQSDTGNWVMAGSAEKGDKA